MLGGALAAMPQAATVSGESRYERGAAGAHLGRPDRSAAQDRDRAGGGGAAVGHRDLSGADRRAAVRAAARSSSWRCSISIWCCCWRSPRWWRSGWSRSGPSGGAALPARGCRCGWSCCSAWSRCCRRSSSRSSPICSSASASRAWFSDKVRTAISESVAVADAYVKEHQQAIRADALAMATDLDRDAATLQLNPQSGADPDRAGGDARADRGGGARQQGQRCWRAPAFVFALGFEDVSPDALQPRHATAKSSS